MEINYHVFYYLIPIVIISFIGYMYIYIKRKSWSGLCRGISNFIILLVVILFLIMGIGITVILLRQKEYWGLIIPIGWFLICYSNLRKVINDTFDTNIKGLFNFASKVDINVVGPAIILGILLIVFIFVTASIFFEAVPDTRNQPNGTFPVVIAGIVFMLAAIGIGVLFVRTVTKKIVFQRTGLSSFESVSNVEQLNEEATSKEKEVAIQKDKSETKTFLLIWLIFFGLIVTLIIYLSINNNDPTTQGHITNKSYININN